MNSSEAIEELLVAGYYRLSEYLKCAGVNVIWLSCGAVWST